MASNQFDELIDALGKKLGALDNQVEKWVGESATLQETFAPITSALTASFGEQSAPVGIFSQAVDTYEDLSRQVAQANVPEIQRSAALGLLNLRFYIMLNAFLSAASETMQKTALNEGLDPAQTLLKSYYAPYFFERRPISTDDMIAMLEADLTQLRESPRDTKGVMSALRIRKGTFSSLAEMYCSHYPLLYYYAQQLEQIRPSKDPAVIDAIEQAIEKILTQVRQNKKRSETR